MDKTLSIINTMQQEGLFTKYAIGGGIAALFYIEPIATFDLDIFILLPEDSGTMVSLAPIYQWLEHRGYKSQYEQVVIEGIPVQFIPVYNDLVREAVLNAVEQRYEDIITYVLKPEYLLAIMLQAYRPKDKDRIIKFLDEAEISFELLDKILVKHNLKGIFNKFRKDYHAE